MCNKHYGRVLTSMCHSGNANTIPDNYNPTRGAKLKKKRKKKYQELARMCGNMTSHALVGAYVGTTTLKNCLAVPSKVRHPHTL